MCCIAGQTSDQPGTRRWLLLLSKLWFLHQQSRDVLHVPLLHEQFVQRGRLDFFLASVMAVQRRVWLSMQQQLQQNRCVMRLCGVGGGPRGGGCNYNCVPKPFRALEQQVFELVRLAAAISLPTHGFVPTPFNVRTACLRQCDTACNLQDHADQVTTVYESVICLPMPFLQVSWHVKCCFVQTHQVQARAWMSFYNIHWLFPPPLLQQPNAIIQASLSGVCFLIPGRKARWETRRCHNVVILLGLVGVHVIKGCNIHDPVST